jgi:hypothetical protein
MKNLAPHLRHRIAALGALSRPLGETRAAAIAREVASTLVADVSAGRDPETCLNDWLKKISKEIAESHTQHVRKSRHKPVAALLPEVA